MNRIARFVPTVALSVVVIGAAATGSAVAAAMVTSADIKNNTVASIDVKNGTLVSKDLKNGAVKESKLATGVKNKLNEAPLAGYQVVTGTITVPTAGQESAFVACPAGKIAVSGGGSWEQDALNAENAVIVESAPNKQIGEFFANVEAGDTATAWRVTARHNSLDALDLTAYVVCVSAN